MLFRKRFTQTDDWDRRPNMIARVHPRELTTVQGARCGGGAVNDSTSSSRADAFCLAGRHTAGGAPVGRLAPNHGGLRAHTDHLTLPAGGAGAAGSAGVDTASRHPRLETSDTAAADRAGGCCGELSARVFAGHWRPGIDWQATAAPPIIDEEAGSGAATRAGAEWRATAASPRPGAACR